MIGNKTILPSGYGVRTTVDLKKDRKVAAAIQVVFVAIAVAMVGVAVILDFPFSNGLDPWATILLTVTACLFYMFVHELTHAGMLRMFTGARPAIALRLPYLVVGGRGYLNTRCFLLVDLAPVILWGVVLVTLLITVPEQFFLTVYIVTILNFAGSSGDYFQAFAVARLPPTALIQDDGKVTTVYLPAGWIARKRDPRPVAAKRTSRARSDTGHRRCPGPEHTWSARGQRQHQPPTATPGRDPLR